MRSKLKLLAISAAFIGPFFIAMLMYFLPDAIFIPAPKSHGELIRPAQVLAKFTARSIVSETLSDNAMKGKWTLLYWGKQHCDLFCQTELFKMRQVRLSLGKDISRLQTLYLAKQSDAPDLHGEALTQLNLRNPRLIIARLEKNSKIERQMDAHPLNSIYLIDPMGNLMMRYSDMARSKGMLKDIKKLLKISKIG